MIMDIRLKVIDKMVSLVGLNRNEVMSYWQREIKEKEEREKEYREKPLYWYQMPEPDIRSQVHLLDYAFEGGKFSPNPRAYPNCQGVVGYINPYADAHDGNKIFVVLPEQDMFAFAEGPCEVNTSRIRSGREATLKLIEYGKKFNLAFPAAEYAFNYCKNGIKQGEAFLPSITELNNVCSNADGVRKALERIGGSFEGGLWSSTEAETGLGVLDLSCDNWYALCANRRYPRYESSQDKKTRKKSVSCFIAY